MRAEDLFGIDVAAELAALCGNQLQGPWQVPAELVRLAVARGAARVEINRAQGGIHFRCDGILAGRGELQDLAVVFDSTARRSHRQEAISRVETAGLSALLWAAGLPGARLELRVLTSGWSGLAGVHKRRFDLGIDETDGGAPSTTLTWSCRGLAVRRAEAWLRTALRFVPIPVTVRGRPVDRGFADGLYRMRICDPLPGEVAVTSTGEAPNLWLLVHGVLSTRAVVPGFPAFSAALEMGDVAGAGSSADELRAAANPHLEPLIDEAARMLLLLVDRLPTVEEPVRRRLTTLLLGFAVCGRRREQIVEAPIVNLREGSVQRMESPSDLERRAAGQGGVIAAVEPGFGDAGGFVGPVLELTTEERGLLSELVAIRIENLGQRYRREEIGRRITSLLRGGWRVACGLFGPPALPPSRLTAAEIRLLETASTAGVEIGLCRGTAAVRRRGSRLLVGRERPEVVAAAKVVDDGDEWLYPAILAVAGEDLEISGEIRDRWRRGILNS